MQTCTGMSAGMLHQYMLVCSFAYCMQFSYHVPVHVYVRLHAVIVYQYVWLCACCSHVMYQYVWLCACCSHVMYQYEWLCACYIHVPVCVIVCMLQSCTGTDRDCITHIPIMIIINANLFMPPECIQACSRYSDVSVSSHSSDRRPDDVYTTHIECTILRVVYP